MSTYDRKVRPDEFLRSDDYLSLQCAVGKVLSFKKAKEQTSADDVLSSKKKPSFSEQLSVHFDMSYSILSRSEWRVCITSLHNNPACIFVLWNWLITGRVVQSKHLQFEPPYYCLIGSRGKTLQNFVCYVEDRWCLKCTLPLLNFMVNEAIQKTNG